MFSISYITHANVQNTEHKRNGFSEKIGEHLPDLRFGVSKLAGPRGFGGRFAGGAKYLSLRFQYH